VEDAARSYFAAFAAREYSKVCDGLNATNREDLQGPSGSSVRSGTRCASALKALIAHSPIVDAGRRVVSGDNIEDVLVRGDMAFVLFRASGGEPSYLQ